jgi:hypothetical protein
MQIVVHLPVKNYLRRCCCWQVLNWEISERLKVTETRRPGTGSVALQFRFITTHYTIFSRLYFVALSGGL